MKSVCICVCIVRVYVYGVYIIIHDDQVNI
jgi:hypothetical protein